MQQTYLNAVSLHQQGQFDQAEALYRRVLSKLPDHPDVLNALGMLCQQTGRATESRRLLERAIRFKKDAPQLYLNLAEACRTLGDTKSAMAWCQKALQLGTDNPDAHFCLASALHDAGALDKAIASYRRAIQLRPHFPEAHNSLGAALDETKNLDAAIQHFRAAITLAPTYAAAQMNLAKALRRSGDLHAAQQHYRLAMDSGDASINTRLAIGEIWVELQEYERAVPYLSEVIRLDPTNAQAYNGLGLAELVIGHREKAQEYFERALEANPAYCPPLMNLAQNGKVTDCNNPLIGRIQTRLADQSLDPDSRAGLQYALGKILDDCQAYDDAFASISKGARLTHQMAGRSIEEYRAEFKSILDVFTPALFERYSACGNETEVPVFIVGMPRSGTSLTEQIVSSHPAVAGVGELMLMTNIEQHLAEKTRQVYPNCLRNVTQEMLQKEAEWYLSGLKHFSEGVSCARITDKMPHNFIRLGLISLLFPNAKVIHCRRDAMDNCLSIFFQKFIGNGHKYSYDLTLLGQYYRLYQDLMRHWREVLPISILDVDYEVTTADPVAMSRRIIDFVGLPWDDACLSPHKLDRTVKTASQWQVRQPIYKTSVQRWRHYEQHLGPLKDALGYEG